MSTKTALLVFLAPMMFAGCASISREPRADVKVAGTGQPGRVAKLAPGTAAASGTQDLVIADFEGKDYGGWKVTGEAFGPGPARGTLSHQMQVSGHKGKGLVNTYFRGDRTKGTLTSPPFKIQRRYINFLVGGGLHPGKTCINLRVGGNVVRTATGPNDRSGGSEFLDWHAWGVAGLLGRTATIQIVDQHSGGWGHINVDHIIQSNTKAKPQKPSPSVAGRRRARPAGPERTMDLTLTKRYLLLPVRNGARKCRVRLEVEGESVREFDIELADGEPSFWAFIDLSRFQDKSAKLIVRGAQESAFKAITQGDAIPGEEKFYKERLRPQFHFSQKIGWNNDPNGMVYYDGEYHLYFQHNPYGWKWGNMHWGHAISRDLVHWEQLPIAIYNHRFGDWAFSGSAVVDANNTAGFQTGREKVLIAAYTSTGRGECIAFSNDRGRTFTDFAGNPVVKHRGRDPKIIWHEPTRRWVMAVFNGDRKVSKNISFYTSPDLKTWQFQSKLPGYYECPEIFELPVDGDAKNTRWVVFAADARYAIGAFDGKTFTPEHQGKRRVHYGRYYASQTFSNEPNGRRIQIGWARIDMKGMPFNQMMTFPHQLTLHNTKDGIRMFAVPIREIELLHKKSYAIRNQALADGQAASVDTTGALFDIRVTFAFGDHLPKAVGLRIGKKKLLCDLRSGKLMGAPAMPVDGTLTLQVLIDRPSIEICVNGGRAYITEGFRGRDEIDRIEAFCEGGEAELKSLVVYELKSIWNK